MTFKLHSYSRNNGEINLRSTALEVLYMADAEINNSRLKNSKNNN
jgi:hypothetical protein